MSLSLYLYARNLKNKGFGTIDPYVIATNKNFKNVDPKKIRTETKDNTINPTWGQPIILDYGREDDVIEFRINDEDIGKDDFVDKVECKIADLLSNAYLDSQNYQKFSLSKGSLSILAMTEFDLKDVVKIHAQAFDLPKMDTFGKCDPFFELWVHTKI